MTRWSKNWRTCAYTCLVLAFGFFALNSAYFWKHITFAAIGPPNAPAYASAPGATTSTAILQPDLLKIDSLGVVAPVKYVTEKNEEAFQEALKQGVVHYPGTALPGENGNVYIFGHSSDYAWTAGEYKTVFALLTKLTPGAHIIVTDHEGKSFDYVVTSTAVVGPKDMQVLDQQGYAKKLLTLQTSYPIGTALKRFIVVAELQQ